MICNNYDWYPEECARADESDDLMSATPPASVRSKWLTVEHMSFALSALVGVLLIAGACVYFAMPDKTASSRSAKSDGPSSFHPLNLMLWVTGRDMKDLSSSTDFPTGEPIECIDFQQSQIDWQQQMSLGSFGDSFEPQDPQRPSGPSRRSR
jgi:hypothetical protein